ncbi:hypothetical protein [Iodobacter fluviatilis]|uniref:hypothetical protein n=1 Tax=Iodobacter fluviatilis TaxID=537 RepID=UPI00165D91B5|nr:hypothetical protein [Iodobacter fluviatilis]
MDDPFGAASGGDILRLGAEAWLELGYLGESALISGTGGVRASAYIFEVLLRAL